MKRKHLFIAFLIIQLIAIKSASAQTNKRIIERAPSFLTKTIKGNITWDTINCAGINPWKNVSSTHEIATIYNFQIKVSTVNNAKTSLAGPLPDKLIQQARVAFSRGDANHVDFLISNIPQSINQVYVSISSLSNLDPSGIKEFSFNPQVLNVDNNPKTIVMFCQRIPE